MSFTGIRVTKYFNSSEFVSSRGTRAKPLNKRIKRWYDWWSISSGNQQVRLASLRWVIHRVYFCLLGARARSKREKGGRKKRSAQKEERRWENTRMLIVQAPFFFSLLLGQKICSRKTRKSCSGHELPFVPVADRDEKELNHRALQSCYLNAAIAFTCFTRRSNSISVQSTLSFSYFLNGPLSHSLI